jgi:hypothetical protein
MCLLLDDRPHIISRRSTTTVIARLKYFLKKRNVHHRDTHMKFAWYLYTMHVMELAMEEIIWAKTVAKR